MAWEIFVFVDSPTGPLLPLFPPQAAHYMNYSEGGLRKPAPTCVVSMGYRTEKPRGHVHPGHSQ